MWLLEVDEQHADVVVSKQITHRIKHAVAIVAGKRDGFAVDYANESWIAALVRDSRPALVIDGRQKEHVTAFDKRLVLWWNLGEHHARFDIVSKPPRVEAILQ